MGKRLVAVFYCVGVCFIGTNAFAGEKTVDFNHDVRHILSNHCYACHGPDAAKRKGRPAARPQGRRLQEAQDTAISPSSPATSRRAPCGSASAPARTKSRCRRPTSANRCRRKKSTRSSTGSSEGAQWEDHWAYVAPKRPPLPEVKNKAWPRNDMDYFILSRLEKEGLQPSPEADKATLLRRVSFDLTGLPPTPAEVDAFLADSSPDAYEKVVDRLLASPAYGERMAVQWLDLARYADTNGYHIDNAREMWLWREWVINAFNKNMPFDQFTVEQLAGDLLPNATLDQKIASGFNRNQMVNFEGGADPNEYLSKYIEDRVVTTATVWLGTTIACTECHDHKYDPFTQKEFYQFYAFFNGIPENGLDGTKENPVPSLRVPTAEQTAKLKDIQNKRTALAERIKGEMAKVHLDESAPPVAAKPPEPREIVWLDDAPPAGRRAAGQRRDSVVEVRDQAGAGLQRREIAHAHRARPEPALLHRRDAAACTSAPAIKFFTYVWLDPKNPPKEIMLQFNDGSWEHRAYWGGNHIDWGVEKSPSRLAMGPLPEAGQVGAAGSGRSGRRPGRRGERQRHGLHAIRRHGLLGQGGSGNAHAAGDDVRHASGVGSGERRQAAEADPGPDRRGAGQAHRRAESRIAQLISSAMSTPVRGRCSTR